ncbi:8-amino-7-oxononanoate synthase [Fictibacillus macauensis ZFHKF-1]|uniref:8-amino-7-ketopelargonate synthase n=1 Tax=Fictibacillus macauensis ZFHKF-1 TaxID=1196324 RepID=I8AMW2_9BACL|nr:8-amino-7-oxononanoate synthase [Fictibacillus macauensis]EIT87352.1 8-amino-7-oxononanoate synthase [Fictibacillus macauensis ZFHKF-1]
MNVREELKAELNALEQRTNKRSLHKVEQGAMPWLQRDGRRLLNLASNNYLGLAGDPRLTEASMEACKQYGNSASASRLVTGNHLLYDDCEQAVAAWKKTQKALIFTSGYTANVGILSALLNHKSIVFSDKLNHASITDGIILSRADHKRYRHLDVDHLEKMLQQAPAHKRKIIVTDSIFSMDGDIAPLQELVLLKERYNALLIVDEAHSSGLYGATGAGLVQQYALTQHVDLVMGTFSKALGSFGAYVTGDEELIDYVLNKARSFIYTTALPPAVLGAIAKSIEIVSSEPALRETVLAHATYFRQTLTKAGFNLCGSESQIVPILIGHSEQALRFSEALQEEGIAAVAIRPPTVPQQTARIRFTLMASHKREEVQHAAQIIIDVGQRLGVI